MAWTDEDEQPTRTRDELLSQVERRGTELRRQRRAGLGVASFVALLAALAVGGSVIAHARGDGPVRVATDGPSTTTSPAGDASSGGPPPTLPDQLWPSPTDSGPPSPFNSEPNASVPQSTAPSVTRRSTHPAVVATTTSAAITTTSALPAPEQPRCGPDQLAVTLTPAKRLSRLSWKLWWRSPA